MSFSVAVRHRARTASSGYDGVLSVKVCHSTTKYFGFSFSFAATASGVRLPAISASRWRTAAARYGRADSLPSPRGVAGVEPAESAGAFVGPVAAALRRRETEAVGQQNGVVGDLLGRVEVLVEQRGGNVREGLGGVGEPLPRGTVGRELTGRPEVHPGQIADRAVVLGVAQTAERDVSRVAGTGAGFGVQKPARPGDHPLSLLGSRLRLILRRHLPGFELLDHPRPRFEILSDLIEQGEPFQVETAFLDLRGMAGQTVFVMSGRTAVPYSAVASVAGFWAGPVPPTGSANRAIRRRRSRPSAAGGFGGMNCSSACP